MKNLISIVAFSLLLGACSNSARQADNNTRTKAILDSVNAANAINTANLERQRTIDSMNEVNAEKTHHHMSYIGTHNSASQNNTSSTSSNNAAPAKKKMNNKTKGALIGAGSGAVLGAVTGVLVDGKKGEGAVVGGLIGAAAGAGAGAVTGNSMDKKKAAETATAQ